MKDTNRLIKKITEKNPQFLDDMRKRNIKPINIDADKSKMANWNLLQMFKESLKNWRNEIDYAMILKKDELEISCRLCGNDIPVSKIESHNSLCLKRIETKKKTSKIDKKFLDISARITTEISGMTKAKISSAVLRKRTFFDGSNHKNNQLPISSPLITNRGINKLKDMVQPIHEENKTSTPSLPSRSSALGLAAGDQFGMNKIIRRDISPKKDTNKLGPDDWQRQFNFQSLTARDRDPGALKPPLPAKSIKEEPILKEQSEQKSESKINTTTETTPDVKQVERKVQPPIVIETEKRDPEKKEAQEAKKE